MYCHSPRHPIQCCTYGMLLTPKILHMTPLRSSGKCPPQYGAVPPLNHSLHYVRSLPPPSRLTSLTLDRAVLHPTFHSPLIASHSW